MEEECPYFAQLLPKMIDDGLRLTLDKIFGSKGVAPFSEPTNLLETPVSENIWEWLLKL
jgi:hypothetical protein